MRAASSKRACRARDLGDDAPEGVRFDVAQRLLGGQDDGFVFLELRGEIAGRIGQRLFGDVVVGQRRSGLAGSGPVALGGGQRGGGDLQVVPEDPVVARFEGADSGALALGAFQARDPFARFSGPHPMPIELGRKSGADRFPPSQQRRRLVGDRPVQHRGYIGNIGQRLDARHLSHDRAQVRNQLQRRPQRRQLARSNRSDDRPVHQPLDIPDRAQRLSQLAACQAIGHEALDSVQPSFDRVSIEQRLTQPATQQPPTHRRAGLVEHREQTVPAFAATAFGELQIAAGLIVERHEAIDPIGGEGLDLGELRALRIGEIAQQAASGPGCERQTAESEAIERANLEVPLQRLGRAVDTPMPVVGRTHGQSVRQPDLIGERRIVHESVGMDELDDPEARQFAASRQQARCLGIRRKLGGKKLASGDIGGGDAGAGAFEDDRGDEVVPVRVEHRRFGDGPWGDDAGDIALDQALRLRCLADLLAHGDLVPRGDQLADVSLGGVVGNSGQGNAMALAHLAAGEHDIEHAGGDDGVVLEGLVEVAQPKEEDDVGVALLDIEVLAAQRHDPLSGRRIAGGAADSGFWFRHPSLGLDRWQRSFRRGGGRASLQDTLPIHNLALFRLGREVRNGNLCAVCPVHR